MKKKVIQSKPKKFSIVNSSSSQSTYTKDFYKWTKEQAHLLKKKKLDALDIENIAEEVESLGKSDKRALRSHLIILLMHLLKKQYQPEGKKKSNSWEASIDNASLEIKLILEDSPSLKKEFSEIYGNAYQYAREKAAIETQLAIKNFPESCPWKLQEVLPFVKSLKKRD